MLYFSAYILPGVYWNGLRLVDWAAVNKAYEGDTFLAPHLFAIPRPGYVSKTDKSELVPFGF